MINSDKAASLNVSQCSETCLTARFKVNVSMWPAVVLLLTSLNTSANCPTGVLQALTGSGTASKAGEQCGTGCERKYYRAQNANNIHRETLFSRNINPTTGQLEHLIYHEYTTVSGSSISYVFTRNPLDCSLREDVTISGADTIKVSRVYHENHTTQNSVQITDCHYVVKDQQVVEGTAPCDVQFPNAQGLQNDYKAPTVTVVTGDCGATFEQTRYDREVISNGKVTGTGYYLVISSTTNGLKDEYRTEDIVDEAELCARSVVQSKSFEPNCAECLPRALSTLSVNGDSSTASTQLARWRIEVSGSTADDKLEITLVWRESVNGVSTVYNEIVQASGSDQKAWYYPSQEGQLIDVTKGANCNFSYEKELVSFKIALAN